MKKPTPAQQWTDDQLTQIEEMAALQFSPDEVATIVDIPKPMFLAMVTDEDHPVAEAFHRGRLKQDAAVRKAIFQQAIQGSTPAQKHAADLIKQAKRQDRKR